MKTSYKLAFVNTVIAIGVIVIVWVQWPDAMKTRSIGIGYEQGMGASVYLAILMTGIPALIYAIGAHVVLTHFLFRPGELKAHRARRLVESMRTGENPKKSAAPSNQSGNHDFID
jgi:hypothetical protein